MKNSLSSVHVLHKTLNLVISRCCFAGDDTSSETQGQAVGGGRNSAKKVFKNGRRSPWVPSLTGPFPNGFVNPGSRLGRKKPLYYSAQLASSNSRITFACSYTAIVVPPYLSGSFTKVMSARETFSLTFLTGDERTNDDLGNRCSC